MTDGQTDRQMDRQTTTMTMGRPLSLQFNGRHKK